MIIKKIFLFILIIIMTCPISAKFIYPSARMDDVTDDYYGTKVSDPYRWLEEPDSKETMSWVEEENKLTFDYLNTNSEREHIKNRLTELWNYPKYSAPHKEGNRYFFYKNDGLQNQYVLYMQKNLDSEPVVVLNPNEFSIDGTVSINRVSYSNDGTLIAYGLSTSGSDWKEIKIRNIDKGKDYNEIIKWSRNGGIAWKHDNSGFYYNRYPAPGTVAKEDETKYNRVYWHKLDTPQSEDKLVYERPDCKEMGFYPFITDDGEYLVLHVSSGTSTKNRVYYRRTDSDGDFIRLLDEADASYDFIDNSGSKFYFKTDLDAPKGKIISIDLDKPDRKNWHIIVPEQSDNMSSVVTVNNQFVIEYMHDVCSLLNIYDMSGTFISEISLPVPGSIGALYGKMNDKELFFSFTSFLYPTNIYRYDFTEKKLNLFRSSEIKFDSSPYETKQIFYKSKDGTDVPVFITCKKGLPLDGSNPVILYGYGGFCISKTPFFSTPVLLWLEEGGIYAVANIRGGGEYGEEWHKAGMLQNKQNVFDDFIAAGEYLIEHKYTSSKKLAIQGGSNGGLLVASCMIQRPELFGAVICEVPLTDMLRYHKFTVGHYWIPEYGSSDKKEDFDVLYRYSPLHNIKEGVTYPSALIMSADHDDRVVAAHAKKFAATLQEKNGGDNPILLRIETKAGHGEGKPMSKIIDEYSDIYAFLFKVFGMKFTDVK
ncbi:MAG: prolyl oligopeptidase family serine peptidase [Candidatus Eremiobacterota bacterium]